MRIFNLMHSVIQIMFGYIAEIDVQFTCAYLYLYVPYIIFTNRILSEQYHIYVVVNIAIRIIHVRYGIS